MIDISASDLAEHVRNLRSRKASRFRILVCLAATVLAAFPAGAAAPSTPRTEVPVPVEVVKDATVIPAKMAPVGAAPNGREGRVQLACMVDPRGKPFEVTVMQSTGDKVLEEMAIHTIERSTFEPASVNGKPIEGELELILKYTHPQLKSASRQFMSAYKSLAQAIAANDRVAADAAIGGLKVNGLYEDALMGVALYNYARRWGDDAQQLTGMQRALSGSDLLPPDLYQAILAAALTLEVKTLRYGEALSTWQLMQKRGVAPDVAAHWKPIIEQLEKARTDDSSYELPGALTERGWYVRLFKTHFRAAVDKGSISRVKLRCKRKFLSFNFDPSLQYEVHAQDGDCVLALEGQPGTEFRLVQF